MYCLKKANLLRNNAHSMEGEAFDDYPDNETSILLLNNDYNKLVLYSVHTRVMLLIKIISAFSF